MNFRVKLLKFLCPVGEKERREFRREVARMQATAEDMQRTMRDFKVANPIKKRTQ